MALVLNLPTGTINSAVLGWSNSWTGGVTGFDDSNWGLNPETLSGGRPQQHDPYADAMAWEMRVEQGALSVPLSVFAIDLLASGFDLTSPIMLFGHNQTSMGITRTNSGAGSFTYTNVTASFAFLNDATVYIDYTAPTAPTAVPEPTSLALLSVGLGAGLVRRRFKKVS